MINRWKSKECLDKAMGISPKNVFVINNKALVLDDKVVALLTSIGWEYYYIEDFANAGLYADKALQVDGSAYNAKELKKSIEKRQTNIIDQVVILPCIYYRQENFR